MANVLSVVSYKIFPAKFGGQKGIAAFNEYFSKYHALYCITIEDNLPGYATYKIINTLRNRPLRYINIFYFGLVKKIIRQNNISHVIVEHPYYGWMGLLLKHFCKVKLIIHSHNIEAERFKTVGKWWWKILWRYEKYIHRGADFTFCISEKDRQYFINRYKIPAEKTSVITYGIPWNSPPTISERIAAKNELLKKHSVNEKCVLYLFNGALEYKPNLEAVKNIVERINPIFIQLNISYKIIICGKGLPAEMNELRQYADQNIIYAGFVEDINLYFKGVDIFINPVTEGGGIKTKLVEALGYNLNAVSTINGATGVDTNICNGKLLICENTDWQGFAKKMQKAIPVTQPVTHEFFDNFYWDNIARKAAGIVNKLKVES
ncbi:MAG: glycosyltransferase family 4 protein [Ginsengibacter sp.]